MKKINKIIISIIMFTIFVWGSKMITFADNDYNIGGHVMMDFGNFVNMGGTIICIQKTRHLNTGKPQNYTPVAIITFEGDVATDTYGRTVKDPYNAIMSYILAQQEPIDTNHLNNLGSNKNKWAYLKTLPVQNAVWNHMATWVNNLGIHLGVPPGIADADAGTSSWIDENAAMEGKKHENQAEDIIDNTNKANIRTENYVQNNISYARIGPFNWSYVGTLNSIEVEDQAGRIVSNVSYSQYNGSAVQSGKDFYISIPMNQGVSAITKLTGKGSKQVYYANISFWQCGADNYQNVINRNYYGKRDKETKKSFQYDVKMLGNLKIVKADYDNQNTRLGNVEFVVQQLSSGRFLRQEGNGSISYVDRNQATTFKTNGSGEIYISNIILGNYRVHETKNPHYGYTDLAAAQDVQVNEAGGTKSIMIKNIQKIGNLQINKVDYDNHNIKLPNVAFKIQFLNNGKWVQRASNGQIYYVDANQATTFYTDRNGVIQVNNLLMGNYRIHETSNPNYGYLDLASPKDINVNIRKGTVSTSITNVQKIAHLKVIKVNQDNESVKLENVGFQFQYSNGKWVQRASNGQIYYVDRSQATTFYTNQNGEITIQNLLMGNYHGYETVIPEYGYEATDNGKLIVLNNRKQWHTEKFRNKQKFVKLSGYVWIDQYTLNGKETEKNNLFKTENGTKKDTNDDLLNGITVRLMDRTKTGTSAIVKTTVTNNLNRYKETGHNGNGEYLFTEVLTDKLKDYYIEFEYDGLTYTNVIAHNNQNRGSKAAEKTTGAGSRQEFNQNFSYIEGRSRDTGFTRNANKVETHSLTYDTNQKAHTAILNSQGKYVEQGNGIMKQQAIGSYPIKANTDATNYGIKNHFTYGQEEIKYINLGLTEREQPDMAIIKDINNVKLTINGYENVYYYGQRTQNVNEYGDGFNIGVKFGDKYKNMSYKRAIYQADYEYENPKDKSKELEVYITYQIKMRNKSTNLTTKINSLADYYDERYTLMGAGTSVNKKGNIEGNITCEEIDYGKQGYKKAIVQTNTILRKDVPNEDEKSVFIQFKLSREAVKDILNGKDTLLSNVAEINSYSIFEGNKIYAGIDQNSNPGSCEPWNSTTFEDDTDRAPALILEVANARQMTGKVFLDETAEELKIGQIRKGSGAYENGEKGIEGVEVIFTEKTGSGKIYKGKTDQNGDFFLDEFIPGDYILTYIWGDQTYKVQNYKATIYYDKARYDKSIENKFWYKEKVETRLSDAIDDYQKRLEIDEELKHITNKTTTTKDEMSSNTPLMGIGIEYESTETASTGKKYTYQIKNVDFGIVERARQRMAFEKRIKTLKLTLANGQVMSDVIIKEDANGNRTIEGSRNGITYMPPRIGTIPKNGFIRQELDNELIQGSILEVEYEIKATNESELDYLSENYYHHGIEEGKLVTIAPSGIIDYLDKEWSFDQTKNPQWNVKAVSEVKNLLDETVYNSRKTNIEEKNILFTDHLKQYYLEPTFSAETILKVSKILTTTDSIVLDNEAELVEITKTGGSELQDAIPGNYVPGTGKTEIDDSTAETIIVTPATGENRNYAVYLWGTIIFLTGLAIGIVWIKKKSIKP